VNAARKSECATGLEGAIDHFVFSIRGSVNHFYQIAFGNQSGKHY
jgi:hypothetical protein